MLGAADGAWVEWGITAASIVFVLIALAATNGKRSYARPSRLTVTKDVDLPVERNAALGIAERALQAIGASDVTVDAEGREVVGWTAMTWRSLGERLAIIVTPEPPTGCRLTCSARPAYGTTLVDRGTRRTLIDRLTESLISLESDPTAG
jgi:hypothetical protein